MFQSVSVTRKNKFTDQTKINVHMNSKIMEGSEIIESWSCLMILSQIDNLHVFNR